MVAGRSPEGRTVAGVTTSSSAATLSAPAGSFHEEDVGRTVSGTGVPAGRTIASVQSDTAATMNGNGSANGTATLTLGGGDPAQYGFQGWSPETDAESETYTIPGGAGASAPSVLANSYTGQSQRGRG